MKFNIFFKERMKIEIFILLTLFCYVQLQPPQKTTKGGDLVVYGGGYEMRKKGISSDGSTQFWVCVRHGKAGCPGRAHSAVGSKELQQITAHNHLPNMDNNIVNFKIRAKLKLKK